MTVESVTLADQPRRGNWLEPRFVVPAYISTRAGGNMGRSYETASRLLNTRADGK